ncbi:MULTISPECIES: DotI/IcmL family type IV secretion protein [Pseudomonas]|uniref:Transfer protein, TraM n=1 Tax=Pseudomonas putida (strain DOT-T1E) TaxID=1196325 RepID=G0WPG7_PSEPT|nr:MULTISPECIES: DotI/IcmL family type IV secretion protein [Pseudomonas]AEK25437.1 Transfer protein, TraM [Pseudomonas putida DOT-T1E]MBI6605257.1 DotI/IcmL family type IV secretion protein [Pseudomonas sp. S4_EA_1b]UZM96805.1 DotI/IcmL family type IV secretion protein [Pseudomonas putida DOT-T1E]
MTDTKDAAAPHLDQPGSMQDLGHAAYERELMAIAEKLHQNKDAVDPIARDLEDRKQLAKHTSSIVKSNLVLSWGLGISICLNCVFGWFVMHPHYVYFAADGLRIVRLVPLNEPYITDAEAIQFAREALNRSMTINFTDYRQQLEDVRGDWTKRGFAQYLEQLQSAGYLDLVKTKRMNMTVTTETGVLVKSEMVDGVLVRHIEVPIEIKLVGQTTDLQPKRFIAKVPVARIPTLDSIVGVGLDGIVTTPR